MAVVVSLRDVVDALEMQSEEWSAYLDPATGKVVTISDDERRLVEEEIEEGELPEWQRSDLPNVRETLKALEEDRLLPLPDKFEIHEWSIMRDFANSRDDQRQRNELLDSIHGSGAFRMFKSTIRRLQIEKEWFSFRGDGIEQIAKDWLEGHGIVYQP